MKILMTWDVFATGVGFTHAEERSPSTEFYIRKHDPFCVSSPVPTSEQIGALSVF